MRVLGLPFRPQCNMVASAQLLFTRKQSSALHCLLLYTSQIKRRWLKQGQCRDVLFFGGTWLSEVKWAGKSAVMRWKRRPRAKREMDCSQCQIWLLITAEGPLCEQTRLCAVSRGSHALVDIIHMNRKGQRSDAHSQPQLRSIKARLQHAKWETPSTNMVNEYIRGQVHIWFYSRVVLLWAVGLWVSICIILREIRSSWGRIIRLIKIMWFYRFSVESTSDLKLWQQDLPSWTLSSTFSPAHCNKQCLVTFIKHSKISQTFSSVIPC